MRIKQIKTTKLNQYFHNFILKIKALEILFYIKKYRNFFIKHYRNLTIRKFLPTIICINLLNINQT